MRFSERRSAPSLSFRVGASKTLEAPGAGLAGVEAERDGPGVGERPAFQLVDNRWAQWVTWCVLYLARTCGLEIGRRS